MSSRLLSIVAVGLTMLAPAAAGADEATDYFKGKTVTYIVATAAGGGYDTYGRLVAEYMQKHLPGSTFVVKNVPGAGTLIGANLIYASKPDGLTFGTFNTGLIYSQIVKNEGVKFDLTKMSWIGKAASDGRAIHRTCGHQRQSGAAVESAQRRGAVLRVAQPGRSPTGRRAGRSDYPSPQVGWSDVAVAAGAVR